MQFLNVIIHMQVALTLRVHTVWLAFENLFVQISPKLHSKRVITLQFAAKTYFNEFSFWMNEVPARLIE